uniref:SAM domain-containing protein n=1 Tax=Oxyrrhis marina TaxID=2969 RepID=A0A7S4LPZ4_OXYMA
MFGSTAPDAAKIADAIASDLSELRAIRQEIRSRNAQMKRSQSAERRGRQRPSELSTDSPTKPALGQAPGRQSNEKEEPNAQLSPKTEGPFTPHRGTKDLSSVDTMEDINAWLVAHGVPPFASFVTIDALRDFSVEQLKFRIHDADAAVVLYNRLKQSGGEIAAPKFKPDAAVESSWTASPQQSSCTMSTPMPVTRDHYRGAFSSRLQSKSPVRTVPPARSVESKQWSSNWRSQGAVGTVSSGRSVSPAPVVSTTYTRGRSISPMRIVRAPRVSVSPQPMRSMGRELSPMSRMSPRYVTMQTGGYGYTAGTPQPYRGVPATTTIPTVRPLITSSWLRPSPSTYRSYAVSDTR